MNNIKEGVCINHFPKYNTTDNLDQFRFSAAPTVSDIACDLIKKKNSEVELALEEYLLFKYNISKERLERVAESMHNFKVKGFECVVKTLSNNPRGVRTTYVDKGVCFMRVYEDGIWYRVDKLWEEV